MGCSALVTVSSIFLVFSSGPSLGMSYRGGVKTVRWVCRGGVNVMRWIPQA